VHQFKKIANPQMAHLALAEVRTNAQKTKRAIFCQRTNDNKET
jgi:hypothetical protein